MNGQEYKGFDATEFTAFIQDFIPSMRIFRNRTGVILLIAEYSVNDGGENAKTLANKIFTSTDETNFYQFSEKGCSLNGYEGVISLEDSHHKDKVRSRLYLNNGIAFLLTLAYSRNVDPFDDLEKLNYLDGIKTVSEKFSAFLPAKRNDYSWLHKAVFHPLPEVRIKEYLFKATTGSYLYVDMLEYNPSYKTMRLFTGDLNQLRQISITNVNRAKDGGTTYVYTNEGTLFVPTKIGSGDKKPTWTALGNEIHLELIELETKDVEITYADGFPVLTHLVEEKT